MQVWTAPSASGMNQAHDLDTAEIDYPDDYRAPWEMHQGVQHADLMTLDRLKDIVPIAHLIVPSWPCTNLCVHSRFRRRLIVSSE